jgi:shikimate dehydrogenase
VIDLVYRPRNTRLLREAARAGWDVVDGAEVLVGQAARQFMIWTGRVPDIAAMRAAL